MLKLQIFLEIPHIFCRGDTASAFYPVSQGGLHYCQPLCYINQFCAQYFDTGDQTLCTDNTTWSFKGNCMSHLQLQTLRVHLVITNFKQFYSLLIWYYIISISKCTSTKQAVQDTCFTWNWQIIAMSVSAVHNPKEQFFLPSGFPNGVCIHLQQPAV